MSETARRIAQSEILLAANRILVVIVSLFGAPLLGWTVATVVSLQQQVAIMGVIQAAQTEKDKLQDDLMRDAAQRRDADLVLTQQMRQDMSRVLEKLEGLAGAQRRIETILDGQRAPLRGP